MSLMTRLRRVEAGIEWLETEGVLRLCATKIKWLQMKEQVEARLAREPGHEMARHLGSVMGVKLPPLPAPVVVRPPAPPPPTAPPSPPSAPEPVVVASPPPPKPPPSPRETWETHDIPEHMQIRPVMWRRRGPQDDDDWDDGGRDYGQCLTDYDPLEEEDS